MKPVRQVHQQINNTSKLEKSYVRMRERTEVHYNLVHMKKDFFQGKTLYSTMVLVVDMMRVLGGST